MKIQVIFLYIFFSEKLLSYSIEYIGSIPREPMATIDSIIIFLVNLVIGGIGIYTGAKIVTGKSDFGYAIVTALIGAVVWSVASFILGPLAGLGAILALLAWIAVINYRYSGSWINAIMIGLVSWLAVLVTLMLLSVLGVTSFSAIGIPGA